MPEGAEAMSLLGKPLYSNPPNAFLIEQYEAAKAAFTAHPTNADTLIWYGRRAAYLGNYQEAINIFTIGIEQHPDNPRMYRHRGHRYITVREFDKAIMDLEKGSELIQNTDDEVEPDGMPNELGIPVSTLHGNIYYHLGLAYYLKNDRERALKTFQKCLDASTNDDNIVSATHWVYMILRRMDLPDLAEKYLARIFTEMDVVENQAYYQLCLFYKGLITLEELEAQNQAIASSDATTYGIGNWYYYNAQKNKAKEIFEGILAKNSWNSFGYIAAEADLVNLWDE
ncbi:MAG: hypothetical protein DHS20C18_31890 [Saprospiraceae bacterium]|nr:MAG: hypothetical protein DHS20C18_31890 [Saprospiraceae bacterium]